MNSITALILAGGRGTRIAAQLQNLPKPMAPVAGQPFLEWLTRRLAACGVRDIVLSTGHGADTISDWVQKRAAFAGEKLRCHLEEQALGTGGAIAHCLPLITTPEVLIMNGDTLLLEDPARLLETMRREQYDGAIFVRPMEDASRYGSAKVENGVLHGFQEKQPGKGLISGGAYVFQAAWLKTRIPTRPSSLEMDILPQALADGARIGVVETGAPFIDIGTPETLAAADAFVNAHRRYFEKPEEAA